MNTSKLVIIRREKFSRGKPQRVHLDIYNRLTVWRLQALDIL